MTARRYLRLLLAPLAVLALAVIPACEGSQSAPERPAPEHRVGIASRPMVPRVRTPIDLSDLRDALRQGFRQVAVTEPTEARISVAWSQMLVEHGVASDEIRAVWCFNLGNWDAPRDYSGPVFVTVPEHEDSVTGAYLARHTRPAFSTPEEGAEAWWFRVWSAFPDAFYAMDSGDPVEFAATLKSEGYYTAPVSSYSSGLRYWIGVYWERWPR